MAVDVHISLDGDDEVEAGLGDASGSQRHSGGERVAVHLAYVYPESPQSLTVGTPPDWVRSWLEGRAARADRQVTRAAQVEAPPDPVVLAKRAADQERRAAARQEKVAAGVEELQRWRGDLVRQGLAAVGNESYQYCDLAWSRDWSMHRRRGWLDGCVGWRQESSGRRPSRAIGRCDEAYAIMWTHAGPN